ncbi:hypothetical protein QBC47DRAFT_203537 [Echria macrotheca]|uniref:DUF1275 domain protein n=1 Tax=Echria macrotheca TaxID=438768 RepID=A0AAJ0BAV8_9PEZI|nr:hypothetical protein QBC47DRAFT_203537 [Echria macrotheca]
MDTKESTPPSSGRSSFDSKRPRMAGPPVSPLRRAWTHMNGNVKPNTFCELELVLLTLCIGLQDAVSFPDFHCFASNQTGNTVFLMLAIVLPSMNGDMFVTSNIGVALGFFLGSAWLTGQLGHLLGPRRRWWLVLCNFVQTALVLGTAALQYAHDGGAVVELTSVRTLVAIGMLAAAAGSQVVLSRALGMTEISTAMATAAWVDLVIDPKFCCLDNRPRNRRVAFLAALVLGTIAGAFIYKTVGSPAALVVSGAGKSVVTVMFLFNSAEREEGVVADGEEMV